MTEISVMQESEALTTGLERALRTSEVGDVGIETGPLKAKGIFFLLD